MLLIIFWAMLSTMQDPNTSNLAVSTRVSYRVPAYGRLCYKLVHSADSLLIDTLLFYYLLKISSKRRKKNFDKAIKAIFEKSSVAYFFRCCIVLKLSILAKELNATF